MLIAEHEETEILRHARLRNAPQRAHGFSIRWLFAVLGWRDVCGRRATIRHAAKFNRLLTVILLSDYRLICWASPVTIRGVTMNGTEPAYFDLETVALLREVLEDAWALLRPEQRATMLKTTLAERILKWAAQGERDRERLLDAALMECASEEA